MQAPFPRHAQPNPGDVEAKRLVSYVMGKRLGLIWPTSLLHNISQALLRPPLFGCALQLISLSIHTEHPAVTARERLP